MKKRIRPRGALDRGIMIACFLLTLCGGALGYREMQLAEERAQDELFRTVRLLAETVNHSRLKTLAASISNDVDAEDAEYLRLKGQFAAVLPALPPGCSISLLGRRADKTLYFMLDARPSNRAALPGDEFRMPSTEFHIPFDEKKALVLGPFDDPLEGSSFFAALAPLVEPGTRLTTAVLLLEADARDSRRVSFRAGCVPLGWTLLLIVVLLAGNSLVSRIRASGKFLYAEPLWLASVCLVLSGVYVWSAVEYELRTRSRAFAVLSDFESAALIKSFQNLRDCGLESLGRFFENSDSVEPQEFAAYVAHLTNASWVDTLLWAPAIPNMGESRSLPSAASYVLTFPVRYVAPFPQPPFSLGFDLRSVPSFAHAMEIAARNGTPTADEQPPESCSVDSGCHMVVFRPVRRAGGDLQGFVVAVLDLEMLLSRTTLQDACAEQRVMEVELRRLLPDGEWRKLLTGPSMDVLSPGESCSNAMNCFQSVRPFFVFGQTFALSVRSGEGFESMHPKRTGTIAVLSGVAVSTLLTLLAAFFVNWRSTMLRFVTVKTAALARSESRARKLAHLYSSISEGVMVTDSEGLIEECNRSLEELTGYTLEEMRGNTPRLFSAREGQYNDEFLLILKETGSWEGEIWNRKKDGDVYPVWITFAAVHDEQGRTAHYSGVVRSIGGIKSEQERLNRMAYHDFLTGLPNRALFTDRLEVALARAKREKETVALVFLDLDRFKEINDTFGHETGDDLLVSVAQRLSSACREQDTVARLAGDEFVLVFAGAHIDDALHLLLDRLAGLFYEPFTLAGHPVAVEASFGVALFPEDGADVRTLLETADRAMYAEKTEKKKRREMLPGADA